MATVNKRAYSPQAVTINAQTAGGLLTAVIDSGYDNVLRTPPDGLVVAVVDREIQFVRGSIVSQDWPHMSRIPLVSSAAMHSKSNATVM